MASALVIALVKYGFLALLWLFVLAAVRVVRSDLVLTATGSGPAPARTQAGHPPTAPAQPAPVEAAPVEAVRSAGQPRTLVVTQGPLAGTHLPLGAAVITLGRADDATLVLSDDYASHHHARLVPAAGEWLVEDLGSTNGTFLDQVKITRPTAVRVGQVITIGQTALELRR